MPLEKEEEKSVLELILDLIGLIAQFARQETGNIVEGALIRPARRAGFWLALTIVGATLFALASIFLAVGLFQLLATVVGAAWIAYLIIGAVLFLAGTILMSVGKKYGNRHGNK